MLTSAAREACKPAEILTTNLPAQFQTRPTFFAHDPNADVRSLDHGHVVAAVADGCGASAAAGFEQQHDGGFLSGRAAAAHLRRTRDAMHGRQ
jgi:hypothetical protein